MKTVILLSACASQTKNSQGVMTYLFRFSGYWNGYYLRKVEVKTCYELIVGEEYLIYLKVIGRIKETLSTELLKFKRVKDIRTDL